MTDRMAQTVVCMVLEPTAEPVFHPDSYGYRPGRSALHAVAKARRRCWENDWVIDMDIRAFFDTVPWDLVLRAVKHHSREPWVLLYVKRWLEAPLQLPDGTISERTMGTPQGSAISLLLANLFMHYAFDAWMARTYPAVTFERYCDDAVVHCRSKAQAEFIRDRIAAGWRSAGWSCTGENPDSVLQGLWPLRLVRARAVHVPGVHVPAAAGQSQCHLAKLIMMRARASGG